MGIKRKVISKKILSDLYYKKKMNQTDIGKRFGVSGSVISQRMKEYGLEARVRKKVLIPKTVLRELYCEQKLSMREIGEKLGTNKDIVRLRINEFGFKTREPNFYTKKNIPKTLLKDMYLKKKMSGEEIGKEIGVSGSLVIRALHAHGIKLRTSTQLKNIVLPKTKLKELYCKKKMTMKAVGEEFGVCYLVVRRNLDNYGIRVRPSTDRRRFITKAKLTDMYCKKKMTMEEICKELKTGRTLIRNRLKEFNIEIRPRNYIPYKPPITKTKLTELYCKKRMTIGEVSEEVGIHRGVVRRLMTRYGIESRGREFRYKEISKPVLRRMYADEKLPLTYIADQLNVTLHVVRANLRRYNITVKGAGKKRTKNIPSEIIRIPIKPSEIDNYRLAY